MPCGDATFYNITPGFLKALQEQPPFLFIAVLLSIFRTGVVISATYVNKRTLSKLTLRKSQRFSFECPCKCSRAGWAGSHLQAEIVGTAPSKLSLASVLLRVFAHRIHARPS